jgi:hypothetical protein
MGWLYPLGLKRYVVIIVELGSISIKFSATLL